MEKIPCYIEQYRNKDGRRNVRLRDKVTNKIVWIYGHKENEERFNEFIALVLKSPSIYDRKGEDRVVVEGTIVVTETMIGVNIENKGGYYFEYNE